MVLDSHTHAWGPPNEAHPWINGPLMEYVDGFSTDIVYTAEKLLSDMDDAGIDEAVVVGYPICHWTDNWYTLKCVQEYDRLTGIVMLDQFAADANETLRKHMTVDGIHGIRLGAICPYDRMWETFDPSVTWLRDAIEKTEFWRAAEETDALVQILAHVDQLDQVVELVETYPNLSYALDHFCHANPTISPTESAFSKLEELAEHDVAVKVSEVAHHSNEEFPYRDLHNHVVWLLDTFGRERVVWGSDFPNVSDVTTYRDSLEWLDHVDVLSETDRKWLTGRAYKDLVSG